MGGPQRSKCRRHGFTGVRASSADQDVGRVKCCFSCVRLSVGALWRRRPLPVCRPVTGPVRLQGTATLQPLSATVQPGSALFTQLEQAGVVKGCRAVAPVSWQKPSDCVRLDSARRHALGVRDARGTCRFPGGLWIRTCTYKRERLLHKALLSKECHLSK